MSEKSVSQALKSALEFGPVLLFFVAYIWLRDEVFVINGAEYSAFVLITGGFVVLVALTTFLIWRLTGTVSKMQLVTLCLVVVFGGLTVWLNDERFIKMKPTIIYLIFAGILGVGLLRGQSYLKIVMGELMPMRPDGWLILTRRFTLFFFGLAAANELVWRFMSTDAWVNFKTFGLTAALFVFMFSQAKLFEAYRLESEDNPKS